MRPHFPVSDPGERFIDFIRKKPEHSDAVFKLRIAVVPLRRRQDAPRRKIPFIRRVYAMLSVTLHKAILVPLDEVDHIFCILFCERFQRIQILSVFRKSDRYDGNTLQLRKIRLRSVSAVIRCRPAAAP